MIHTAKSTRDIGSPGSRNYCHSANEEGRMKKRNKAQKNDSATTARRLPALIALALVVLVIGAVSAISRQLVAGKQSPQPENTAVSKDSNAKKYMKVKVAGQDVQVDPQTGKLKPLSTQEAQNLAEGLKRMVNKSADGLTEVQHEDGSTSMELNGRFRSVVVAREREDGTLSMSCVDNPKAAASALGVDQKLLEPKPAPIVPLQN
jgi:hypothetical protein